MSRFIGVLTASLAVSCLALAQDRTVRPGYVPPGVEVEVVPGVDVEIAPPILPSLPLVEEVVDAALAEAAASPKQIQYEIAIVHLVSDQDFTADEQAVAGDNAAERLANWSAEGKVRRSSSFRMSALENLEAYTQIGQSVPIVTGRASNPGGGGRGGFAAQMMGVSQAVQYQEVGTMIRLTGRVEGDAVFVECSAEESTMEEAGVMPGAAPTTEGGPSIPDLPMTGRRQMQQKSTVRVVSGETAILSASFEKGEKGSHGIVVTLSATIAD